MKMKRAKHAQQDEEHPIAILALHVCTRDRGGAKF